MERVTVVGVETIHGLKTVELVSGDVCDLECDLLAVSSFAGHYEPTGGTVIGSLYSKYGLSLEQESMACEFDLRKQFGIWITHELVGYPFARVICVEMRGKSNIPSVALENLYVGLSILEAKNINVATLALPLLGTGNQMLDPEAVVTPLIAGATEALKRLRHLDRVVFATLSEQLATVIRDEIDRQLGSSRNELPRRELVTALLSDIRASVDQIRVVTSGTQRRMADELLAAAIKPDPTAMEIGLLARRLAEVITDSFYKGKPKNDLFLKIDGLGQRGISPWVVSYLHTLRVIGNEVVHIRDRERRLPPNLANDDVALCLFCILRVTKFWLDSVLPTAESQDGSQLMQSSEE